MHVKQGHHTPTEVIRFHRLSFDDTEHTLKGFLQRLKRLQCRFEVWTIKNTFAEILAKISSNDDASAVYGIEHQFSSSLWLY